MTGIVVRVLILALGVGLFLFDVAYERREVRRRELAQKNRFVTSTGGEPSSASPHELG
jgi:hypothetical protein